MLVDAVVSAFDFRPLVWHLTFGHVVWVVAKLLQSSHY